MSEGTQTEMAIPKSGEVIWTEIATNNLAECRNFYKELFGWEITKTPSEAFEYLEIKTAAERPVGGMYDLQEADFGDEVPPHFMLYMNVDDVDAAADHIKTLGGTIITEPTDIENTGRMCVAQDPTGAMFALIKITNF